jgi:YD repeat-containing protein
MLRECHRHVFGEDSQATLAVSQPIPAAFDSEKRLDYDSRTDDNPVYIGFAETPFTGEDNTWKIQKLTYDASDRITRIEVATGTWTNRATLF